MFASTNVFTASPELPDWPFVETENGADPLTERTLAACPVTVPGVGEVKTIVHCPAAFVFGPASSQVLEAAFSTAAAPFAFNSAKPTCSPAAATNVPVPGSFISVTVKVCGWPTSFVASGVIAIFAFTHVFVAGPEFAPAPFVCRVSETPPIESVEWALTVDTPVTLDTRSTVQLPPETTVHGFADVKPPGPESIVKLICVPAGALTNPAPEPSLM